MMMIIVTTTIPIIVIMALKARLIGNFYLSVPARTIVEADPPPYTSPSPPPTPTPHPLTTRDAHEHRTLLGR